MIDLCIYYIDILFYKKVMHPENISRQSRECPLCLCKYPESREIWKDIQCKSQFMDLECIQNEKTVLAILKDSL